MATLYIGTYSYRGSRGIYRAQFDMDTGSVSGVEPAAELPDPGYLCLDAEASILYSTANPQAGAEMPSVVAFRISVSGALQRIGSAVADKLKFCQMSLSPDRKLLFAAAYGDAAVAVFRLEDGIPVLADIIRYSEASCEVASRQSEPHVHSITPSVSGRYVFVCDFSADRIRSYSVSDAGSLAEIGSVACAPGSGPRHLVCHPDGEQFYVVNELSCRVDRFGLNRGVPELIQSIATLPEDYAGENTAAEILLSPDAKYLYVTNRGHDSIACYRLDRSGCIGAACFVPSGGEHPRNAVIAPGGRWMPVANRDSDSITVFELVDGIPQYRGRSSAVAVPMGMAVASLVTHKPIFGCSTAWQTTA